MIVSARARAGSPALTPTVNPVLVVTLPRAAPHREFVRGVGPRVEDLRRDAQVDGEHPGQHQDRDAMRSHGRNVMAVTFAPAGSGQGARLLPP